jgi:hypothetical protein
MAVRPPIRSLRSLGTELDQSHAFLPAKTTNPGGAGVLDTSKVQGGRLTFPP